MQIAKNNVSRLFFLFLKEKKKKRIKNNLSTPTPFSSSVSNSSVREILHFAHCGYFHCCPRSWSSSCARWLVDHWRSFRRRRVQRATCLLRSSSFRGCFDVRVLRRRRRGLFWRWGECCRRRRDRCWIWMRFGEGREWRERRVLGRCYRWWFWGPWMCFLRRRGRNGWMRMWRREGEVRWLGIGLSWLWFDWLLGESECSQKVMIWGLSEDWLMRQ